MRVEGGVVRVGGVGVGGVGGWGWGVAGVGGVWGGGCGGGGGVKGLVGRNRWTPRKCSKINMCERKLQSPSQWTRALFCLVGSPWSISGLNSILTS